MILCKCYVMSTPFPAFLLCCSALAAADCSREVDAFRFWMQLCAKPSIVLLTNPPGFLPLQLFFEDLNANQQFEYAYQNVERVSDQILKEKKEIGDSPQPCFHRTNCVVAACPL